MLAGLLSFFAGMVLYPTKTAQERLRNLVVVVMVFGGLGYLAFTYFI